MKRLLSPIIALVGLLLTLSVASAAGASVTIALPAANASGESGTVQLTASGASLTELVIVLNNQPLLQTKYDQVGGQQVINPATYGGAAPQLASIYTGTCKSYTPTNPPNLGAVTPYGPNVTSNGWLVLSKSVADLLAGNYVVAVHQDATDASPLVACTPLLASAEIPASATLPNTGSPREFLGLLAGAGLTLVGFGSMLRRRHATRKSLNAEGVASSQEKGGLR